MQASPGLNTMPRQNISKSDKTEEWGRTTVNAIIDQCSFEGFSPSNWQNNVHKYYEYYNGIIDDSDYTHVLRPYGKERGNLPAKLHNYPIIKPKVDLLLGEYAKRPTNPTVIVCNSDVITIRAEAKRKKIMQNLENRFLQQVANQGLLSQDLAPQGELPTPENISQDFERNYRDARAIQGQDALSFMNYKIEIERIHREGWFDWLVSGYVFTLKTATPGEVVYELLNPLETDFDKSPDTTFIEDGDWAANRKMVHLSKVIDAYYDVLTKDEITALEYPKNSDSPLLYFGERDQTRNRDRLVELTRVYWKSIKKIGIVSYYDTTTNSFEKYEVEEGYKSKSGEEISWYYVNEVWEGTRIDGTIFKNVRPFPVQRGSLDNPSTCKLPINGRKYSDRNAPNISLVALGIPYQLTYNIYKYRLENEVAKAKGMIALIDVDFIPEEFGSGPDAIDKFLYYVEALGIAFQRRAKEGLPAAAMQAAYLDLTIKTITAYLELLNSILLEWEMVSGVSRQRAGAISQYDGKGTTEQSIIQSSHITEDYFIKYEEFKQREYAGLLDISKFAYINGIKTQYVLGDGRSAFLDLDGFQHMESEYGIFVNSSGKENRKLESLRMLGQQMVQAGNAPLSTIAEIFEADNFVKLKEKIQEVEALAQQRAQAQQQAELAMQQQQIQQEERKIQFTALQKEADRQNKIQIALITADSRQQSGDGVDTDYEVVIEQEEHRDKMNLEERKLDLQRNVENRRLDLQKDKQNKDFELGKDKIAVDRKKAKSASSSK